MTNLKFMEKEAKRFKAKVCVLLLLIQNDEVLLLRRYNTGIADGCYVVPMGGVKEGETITNALIREAKEETDVNVTAADIQAAHVMYRLHHMPEGYSFPQVDVYFMAKNWTGTITNNEPDKCDELKFYPMDALPKTTEPFIAQTLACMREGILFSEFGWESASAASS